MKLIYSMTRSRLLSPSYVGLLPFIRQVFVFFLSVNPIVESERACQKVFMVEVGCTEQFHLGTKQTSTIPLYVARWVYRSVEKCSLTESNLNVFESPLNVFEVFFSRWNLLNFFPHLKFSDLCLSYLWWTSVQPVDLLISDAYRVYWHYCLGRTD